MNEPTLSQIDDGVCATAQPDPSAMAWVAQQGFKSVINNRPDFEGGPTQPTSAAMKTAAEAAGLEYAHLPVHPSMHSPDDIAQMARLIDSMPRPTLLFCRSGARSTKLYHSAKAT